MTTKPSEALRWEEGSRRDQMRNTFIIPQLARIIEAHHPAAVLDVGAGTGYVARAIDAQLTYRPRWTLVDLNEHRLALAVAHKPAEMALETVVGNVFDWPFEGRRFGAVLISFTLLEIEDIDRLCTLIASYMDKGGVLSLAVPDAWVDVLDYSSNDPEIIGRYITGPVVIPKHDKFTDQNYPFRASRVEDLLGRVLNAGFDLFDLQHGRLEKASAFVLAFRRRAP